MVTITIPEWAVDVALALIAVHIVLSAVQIYLKIKIAKLESNAR